MSSTLDRTTAGTIGIIIALIGSHALADRTISYNYNADGLITSVDGPRTDVTDVTQYEYDSFGNRVLIRNALGQETHINSYDGAGRPIQVADPNGLITNYTYDLRGRLIRQVTTDGIESRSTDYIYDPAGNLIQVTSADNSTSHYHYDDAGRFIGVEDDEGNSILYTLDNMGNRTEQKIINAVGTTLYQQSSTYNTLGRLSQNTDSYNNVTTYEYDPVGNTTKTTNARQNDTANAYDALNRVTQVTDAHGGVVQYAYDSQDNLTSVTDALGLITTYSYDGFGNLASLTSPDTGITTYSYDNAGNRLTKTDARGVTTSYSYDAIGRLVSIDNPGNNLDVTFGYDAGTNGIGRLTSMIDGEGTTTYTYSTFGQLSNKSRTGDSNTATTFQYDYDTSGRLASLIYPSGRKVLYSYNTRGEVESLTVEYSDNTTTPLITNITRLPFGAIDTFDYGNGLTLSRTYDQNYRLIDQTIPLVVVNDYQYDPVGNISSLLDQLNSIRDQQFSYDELDRLTDASGPYGVLSYDYDANGNRTSYTDGSGIMYYSYDTTSHNLEQITGTITENRTYDAAGNTTSTADGTFEYDSTNRLFRFTSATLQGDYYYNGWGERIKKTVYGQTTRFRYGENAQLLGEYNGAGSVVREYVYLEGQPVAMLAGSADPKTVYYLHSDHLGAVAKATDSSQAIVWDADRKPFGALTLLSNQIEMPLRFPGQYYDYESGTYYNYFRTYDPSTGRYLESDPIGLSGGLNTYAYVGGNPVNGIDPLGLKELCEWITMYIEYIRNTNIPSRPIGLQTYDLDIRFEHSVTASGGLPNVRKGGRNFPVMPDITPPKAVWVPNTREWESFWEPEEYGYYECYDECGNEIPTDKMPGRKPDSRNGPSDRMDGVWSTFRPPTIQY